MANTIKLKRKSDADGAPTTGDLVAGELALNTFSGRVFLEKSDGGAAIVELIHDQGGQTIGGALTITGAFTSLGIDDNATKEVVQITDNGINLGDGTAAETYLLSIRDVTTGRLTISGGSGTTNGANIALFGETAAGTPGDTQFKTGSVAWQTFDESAGEWTLSTNVKASRADAITVPSSGVVRLNQTLRMTERADHIETPAATFGEIWLRNDAIQSLMFTDDAGTDHDLTAGGFSGLGVWRYSTTTSSTPATGRLQFDNTTIDSATEMYIHDTNDDGTDVNAFLALVEAGDLVYVQVKADSSQFAIVHVGTPSLLSDVFTFPIIDVEYQGSAPSNNTRVTVVTSHGSTGGGGTIGGSITDNQVAVGATAADDIEGSASLTYDVSTFTLGFGNGWELSGSNTTTATLTGGQASTVQLVVENNANVDLGSIIGRTTGTGQLGFADAGGANTYIAENDGDHIWSTDGATEIMRLSRNASGDGTLRITGGIRLTERADHTETFPTATFGEIWIKTATPNELYFTDDAGTDWLLNSAAGAGDVTKVGTPADNQVGVWTGDGTIEGTTGLLFTQATQPILRIVGTNGPQFDMNGSQPQFRIEESDVGLDQKNWMHLASAGGLFNQIYDDAYANAYTWMQVERSGTGASVQVDTIDFTSVTDVTINSATFDVQGNITTTGTVDGIDIATDVAANTAKVTNATHTGQVTGATALALDVTAITAQPAAGAVIGTDTLIINDGGVLSEVTATQIGTFVDIAAASKYLLNTTDTLTGTLTVTADLNLEQDIFMASASPIIGFTENDAAVNNTNWLIGVNGEQFVGAVYDDAFSGNTSWLTVDRTLNVVDSITLAATTVDMFPGGSTATLRVGRNVNEQMAINVVDTNCTFTYTQDETDATPHNVIFNIDSPNVAGLRSYLWQNDSTQTMGLDKDGNVIITGDFDPTVTNTQDIGASGLVWANVWATTFNGTATTAQYADLAEKYIADADYEVGTVVSFGGDKEITQSDEYLDHRIAGIVSADPAFLMNVDLPEGTTVALRGRIPCKVFGDIKKGDLLVSTGDGTACAVEPLEARAGTILGKALEDFTGEYGVIEVVV